MSRLQKNTKKCLKCLPLDMCVGESGKICVCRQGFIRVSGIEGGKVISFQFQGQEKINLIGDVK